MNKPLVAALVGVIAGKQRSLPRKQRKRLRSLMHDFRRRPQDLTPEQTKALEDLFEKVPALA
jgi:hypothetical protein